MQTRTLIKRVYFFNLIFLFEQVYTIYGPNRPKKRHYFWAFKIAKEKYANFFLGPLVCIFQKMLYKINIIKEKYFELRGIGYIRVKFNLGQA